MNMQSYVLFRNSYRCAHSGTSPCFRLSSVGGMLCSITSRQRPHRMCLQRRTKTTYQHAISPTARPATAIHAPDGAPAVDYLMGLYNIRVEAKTFTSLRPPALVPVPVSISNQYLDAHIQTHRPRGFPYNPAFLDPCSRTSRPRSQPVIFHLMPQHS